LLLLRYIPTRATQQLYFDPVTPAADTFGPGANTVSLTPVDATEPVTVPLTIPANAQIFSFQIYLFWFWQTAKARAASRSTTASCWPPLVSDRRAQSGRSSSRRDEESAGVNYSHRCPRATDRCDAS